MGGRPPGAIQRAKVRCRIAMHQQRTRLQQISSALPHAPKVGGGISPVRVELRVAIEYVGLNLLCLNRSALENADERPTAAGR
jgi:hypothetical protein